VGVGIKLGLLQGLGIQGAMAVTPRGNVRVGFNYASYSLSGTQKGANYTGSLNLNSVQANYDWFPFHGSFHISPGVLINTGTPLSATATVPGGTALTLNHVDYYSDPTAILNGSGKVTFNQAAPIFLVGWGNLVPRRRSKHFTSFFEAGFAYQGAPKASAVFLGNDCDSTLTICQPALTDPSFQSSLAAQLKTANNDLSPYRFFPVISFGFGYAFSGSGGSQ
jgi:hypothetical protein